MMNQKNIQLSLLLIFFGFLLYAQEIEDKSITQQIWLDYNPTYSLSEKVDIYSLHELNSCAKEKGKINE